MRVLFVCHGNICRSPMAEFVFRDLVQSEGLETKIYTASAATSSEEIGNPVHYGTRNKLREHGISTDGKYSIKLRKSDYNEYDYIVGMDNMNMKNMQRLFGGDPGKRLHLLLDFAGRCGEEIADPWYTGDFDTTYDDVLAGTKGLLVHIKSALKHV